MSSDCVVMIKAYLDGGDRDGFGSRNPFDNFSGEGGTEGLAKALAVDVKTSDCPDEDTRFSAMLFGKLVGASPIGPEDRMMVQMFMEVAYEDNVTSFNKGLSMIKAVARAAAAVETTGAHGGKVPTDAEAIIIAEEKGMSWQQVVAISSVLFSGTVPTLAEIGQEGYGSDPGQWSSAKEARKAGKPCMNTYLKSGDAEGYRTMITKGATRLAATPHFAPHNLAPPSDMGRDCWTQQCTHAWTPILAAAIQKRDVRVGQGGTRPAYWDLFRTLSPPA